MLISATELAAHVTDPNWTVFDCRFRLTDPNWGKAAYDEGHIPGAHHLDLERDLSAAPQAHGGRHPLPDMERLAMRVGECGARRDSVIVVYDGGEGMAARAWWLLRHIGAQDVRMLDGGWLAWTTAGLPVVADPPQDEPVTFAPCITLEDTVDVDDVRDMVQSGSALLVDARQPARYRGEIEPMDKVAGHIPGAVNRPWEEGIGSDGKWLPASVQRNRFHDLATAGKPIVVYCGSGVTACSTLFAMELAGIQGARLYPGSWSDWISYAENPVAVGDGEEETKA
ncbi:Rhodanese domain-containing protein [Alicyclobacillus hesperidum URH17-3-68]|uniref:3-mercaptopyruvate sulfurtransferase n=1 Tax=Alicyclobacillus hesperidum TaxID=89784 RepID=A0A1H2RSA6_9BACL|nr:sulfurtransferase [Alicyclobacillus hesperidum]EJY55327.1 Rhodanese domain-containing protein [Alicyclobacillus hesperidum URH17-3-68]GLV13489.1 putative 3-mercaptopyruvate sulfurtransferase [Alicyclobacillus hesperidum]SDW22165.1 thiosulfate/3-mercaptopyruvate sulfurtransferase [Alicyclobacillus hesperidum]